MVSHSIWPTKGESVLGQRRSSTSLLLRRPPRSFSCFLIQHVTYATRVIENCLIHLGIRERKKKRETDISSRSCMNMQTHCQRGVRSNRRQDNKIIISSIAKLSIIIRLLICIDDSQCSFSCELVVIKEKSIRYVFSLAPFFLCARPNIRTHSKSAIETRSDDWHSGPYWA